MAASSDDTVPRFSPLLIAFVKVLGSAATADLTGAVVLLTLTLSTLGLLLAIDRIQTAVNVAGQVLVPILVSKREGILDKPSTIRRKPWNYSISAIQSRPDRSFSERSFPHPSSENSRLYVSPTNLQMEIERRSIGWAEWLNPAHLRLRLPWPKQADGKEHLSD